MAFSRTFTFPFILVTWLLVACMYSTLYFRPIAGLAPMLTSGVPAHFMPTAGEFFASWMSGCGQVCTKEGRKPFICPFFQPSCPVRFTLLDLRTVAP
jgi:hypothetical protein